MAAQMYPAHAPGLVEMRVGPFHPLAALPQQALSTMPSNPPPVGIHRFLGCRLALPLAPTAIRLRHIAPDAEIRKPNHRLVAVIPLVAHDLGDSRSAVHRGDVIRRFDQRLDHRRGVAGVGVLHGHPHDGARLQIHRVLGGVRQMRAAVLHLRDLRIGIVRRRPVLVRPLLLPFPIEPRQLGPRGRSDARRFGEPSQPRLVRLARVPTHDAPHRGVGFERRRVDPNRVPLHQVGVRQPLQHPREHRLVRLDVDQPARARQGRMVRRRLVQRKVQELPDAQRIGRAPRDGPLRVQACKIAEQQQSEIAPRRQTRPPDAVGVARRALCLDEGVEAGVVQDAIQPRVEWMPGTFRQIRRGDPHTCLSVTLPLLTHRHTWSIRTETVSG